MAYLLLFNHQDMKCQSEDKAHEIQNKRRKNVNIGTRNIHASNSTDLLHTMQKSNQNDTFLEIARSVWEGEGQYFIKQRVMKITIKHEACKTKIDFGEGQGIKILFKPFFGRNVWARIFFLKMLFLIQNGSNPSLQRKQWLIINKYIQNYTRILLESEDIISFIIYKYWLLWGAQLKL